MKRALSSLIAGMGLSLAALAQDVPKDSSFWQTLSNKQRLLVDCNLLANGQKTVGFYAQYEPYSEEQIKALSPQQQVWLRMSRQSRATDAKFLENLASHLETAHGIKRGEVDAAHQHCLSLQK